MRIALISDVHSNVVALEAVLADAEARGAEAIWNLGDTVGYGPDPNGVVARLAEVGAVSVLGTHDAVATGQMGTEWFNAVAAEAAEWTRAHLAPEAASYLAALGEVVREGEWSLAHGTLRDPLREYLITEEAAAGHPEDYPASTCPAVWARSGCHRTSPSGCCPDRADRAGFRRSM